MPLRRVAQIAVVLGLVAVGVWVVRGKKWELLRKPTEVAAKPAPAIKPRSAADIIPQLKGPSKRTGVTLKELLAGKVPQLNQLEVEAFLKNQGRSTPNLLAASRLLSVNQSSGGSNLLLASLPVSAGAFALGDGHWAMPSWTTLLH